MLVRGTKDPFFMSKQDKLIGGIAFGVLAVLVLSLIANNPRVPLLYRHYAWVAEGEIVQHVITGDLVKLVA
jgi:hypothetical protein